ncbi:MAG: hypothetical protein US25_C0015G0010, partial [Candidatus Moranbacteria bacterium GW2011_GWE1_36_7]
MFQDKIRKFLILVVESLNKAFAKAFSDVREKKFRGFFLLALVVTAYFAWGCSASLNWLLFLTFLFYGWENRIVAILALISLATCPFLLAFKKDTLAETMAVSAYFFLVMTVVLQMVEFKREERNDLTNSHSLFWRKMIKKIEAINFPTLINKIKNLKFKKLQIASVQKYFTDEKKLVSLSRRLTAEIENFKFKKPKFKLDKNIFIFLSLSVGILWKLLLPGFVLTLDMNWMPYMPVIINADSFRAFLPLSYLIHWASVLTSAWIVQKVMLVALFSSIGYLAFKYLPVGPRKISLERDHGGVKNKIVCWFSALIYLVNPFVYTRLLAGQWLVLWGYALLPPILHSLFVFQKKKDSKSAMKLFGWLFLLGVFSNHFFVMSAILLAVWFAFALVREIVQKNKINFWRMWKNILLGGVIFLILSSYWLVPALTRQAPLEQRFGIEHWEAFAGGGYKDIDPLLNLVSLNGFWGERTAWAQAFVWPQDNASFWIAFSLLVLLIILGGVIGLRDKEQKNKTLIFLAIGFSALVFSAGAGETIFRNLNLWFFEHVPLWSGFRDSQKFTGFLALSYATLAGMGLSYFFDFLDRKKFAFKNILVPAIFLIPFFLGFLMWGGFHGQLKPVWYPQSWVE